jgi:hypothetical protein
MSDAWIQFVSIYTFVQTLGSVAKLSCICVVKDKLLMITDTIPLKSVSKRDVVWKYPSGGKKHFATSNASVHHFCGVVFFHDGPLNLWSLHIASMRILQTPREHSCLGPGTIWLWFLLLVHGGKLLIVQLHVLSIFAAGTSCSKRWWWRSTSALTKSVRASLVKRRASAPFTQFLNSFFVKVGAKPAIALFDCLSLF